jgi:hypothetical protein
VGSITIDGLFRCLVMLCYVALCCVMLHWVAFHPGINPSNHCIWMLVGHTVRDAALEKRNRVFFV